MAVGAHLITLSNPLATPDQLSTSSSQLDGLSSDLENSIRYIGALLTQAAGILLRLPQEIIAQAIVIFTRFYVGPEGDSFRVRSAKVTTIIKLNPELVNHLTFDRMSLRRHFI